MSNYIYWLNQRPSIAIKTQGVYSEDTATEFLCHLSELIKNRLAELECTYNDIRHSGWIMTEKEWELATQRPLEAGVTLQ